MHIDTLRDHCLSLPGATEDLPFGPDTLVFRVGNKMFALVGLERMPAAVNLKCDPERALDLRERYDAVEPGWHMNKTHWNTVALQSDASDREIRAWVEHSYALVFASLPASVRAGIESG